MFGCLSEAQTERLKRKVEIQKRTDKTQQLILVDLTYALVTF